MQDEVSDGKGVGGGRAGGGQGPSMTFMHNSVPISTPDVTSARSSRAWW